jgi:hypothetical protein
LESTYECVGSPEEERYKIKSSSVITQHTTASTKNELPPLPPPLPKWNNNVNTGSNNSRMQSNHKNSDDSLDAISDQGNGELLRFYEKVSNFQERNEQILINLIS